MGHIEFAYYAYTLTDSDTLYYDISLKKRTECARQLSSKDGITTDYGIKWRAIYLSNLIILSLQTDDIVKQDFDKVLSSHFADTDLSNEIFNPVDGKEENLYEYNIVSEVFASFLAIIDRQRRELQELSQPKRGITVAYDQHIVDDYNEKLIQERNNSPSKRREFDKRFGLIPV